MAMISDQPDGWLKYLQKYANADLIMPDILGCIKYISDEDSNTDVTDIDSIKEMTEIRSVPLKNINTSIKPNYFVRPGQHFKGTKYQLEVLKYVYTRIKALKTILGISLDNYKLKKLLWRSRRNSSQAFQQLN
jgi:hypothetical protein